MIKSIWMSDTHFTREGDVLGHDPRIRLQAAIDHINQYHQDSSFCIISGDMVNHGNKADYQALRKQLDTLRIPYLPMVGNHDERDSLRLDLPLPGNCMTDFVQYSIANKDGLFVFLDTLKTGSDGGEMCDKRCHWLNEILKTAGQTPVFLFMHHPPMPLGLPMQDLDCMEGGDAFLDLISQYQCVKYLFMGHVHRPITGTVRGIPFATMRSVLMQSPAPRPEWTWDTFKPGEEAPSMGVLTIDNASVNLQYEQFCRYELGLAN